jgi:hypothetical protein
MGEIGTGIFGGAATGAGAGFAVGGPIGAGIGALIGGISGASSGKKVQQQKAEFDKLDSAIQAVDPEQLAFLQKLKDQEKYQRAGTDASSAFAMQNQRNALANTQANMLRGGGDMGQMLRAQQAANMGMAGVGAHAASSANQIMSMAGSLTNQIRDQKYKLDMQRRDQALANYTQGKQDLNNMLSAGLSVMPQLAGGLKLPKIGGGAGIGNNFQVGGSATQHMPQQPMNYTPPPTGFPMFNVGVDQSIAGLQV